jgi:ribonucleotide monophosphatase NagD (HAD superfamily)
MIYKNLLELKDSFDVFLLDAYGVFWEGNGFYPNSRETMEELVKSGKQVVIVSNTAILSDDAKEVYAKRGLEQGRDYNEFITAGDLLHKTLLEDKLIFDSNPFPKKYYVIGSPHPKMFEGTFFEEVRSLNNADFVYCGVPHLSKAMVNKYPRFKNKFLPTKADKKGNFIQWDTMVYKPFEKIVNQVAERRIPAVNANPDLIAREGHPLLAGSKAEYVIRNGLVARALAQKSVELIEFGKPHRNIFEYVFVKLAERDIFADKKRTCMVGDTIRTDIKGAINFEIVPVLCLKTGVTAEEISSGKTLKRLCKQKNIELEQIVLINSIGGK